ncbi:uncharacterized protein SOCG_01475 [Schizosaccharomyces octosporus yFS286]|uniref:Zinc finger C2H2 LYAR-type domain-containing protein n=1 Tax=Schizosaccharomyces octosporus (strain yFS286) TaxID=483514 RepID=S9PPV3_SCHOY|nr:uncharacterized protein SOCG_01475 [Schizosaccharomyces octosporus yFS286]EPX71256.1 hypothetical protein SOCG_01475 [Schizosaccharomyces octosporus yFS286]
MVSFCCEVCQDIIKKPKLDQHRSRCQGAYFTCIDCNTTFQGTDYRSHSSCMTEAQRYQKGLYRPTKKELKKMNQENGTVNTNTTTGKAKETSETSEKEQTSSPTSKKRSNSPEESGEEKDNKKKKSSSKNKKSSPVEQMLSLCQKDENESLYKLLKKHNKNASKNETLEAKDVLKQLQVCKNADGVFNLKAGSTD